MRRTITKHRMFVSGVTMLILAALGIYSADARGAYPCLTLDAVQHAATLNLEDGTYSIIRYPELEGNPDEVGSPDGNSYAIVHSDRLYFKAAGAASETLLQTGINDFTSAWSPDGRWYVYLWSDSSGAGHIAAADSHGHVDAQRLSDLDVSSVQFDSWSADTNYFALLTYVTVQGQPAVTLTVLSVADLTIVNQNAIGPIAQYTCVWGEGYGIVQCGFWSPTGHHMAYVLQRQTQQVQILNPGQDYARSVDASGQVGNLIWSPDGTYLVVRDEHPSMLYVVGPKGKVQIAAGAIRIIRGEGYTAPTLEWSEDSRKLFFVQNESDPNTSLLIAFNPDTGEGSILSEIWVHVVDVDESYVFARDHRYVLTKRLNASDQGALAFDLRLIDTKTLRKIILAQAKPVYAIHNMFWTADNYFGIATWDSGLAWVNPANAQVHIIQLPDGDTISSIRVSSDSHWLTYTSAGNGQNSTWLANLSSGDERTLGQAKATAMSFFSPDNSLIAVQTDNIWQLWSIDGTWHQSLSWPPGERLEVATSLPYPQTFIGSTDLSRITPWSPDSSTLVLADTSDSKGNIIEVFARDGTHLKTFKSPKFSVAQFSQSCPSEF